MEQTQAEYTVRAHITDTPQAWIYKEYDTRKRDIFLESRTQEEYHTRLAELIAELGL